MEPPPETPESAGPATEPGTVDPLHPLDAHAIREPLPKSAGIWAVVLTEGEDRAAAVADGLRRLLSGRGRPFRVVVEPYHLESRADRLAKALDGADLPLVLVTTAAEPWTEAHLKPLCEAIDRSDHVLGRRRRSLPGRLLRWLSNRPWAFLFAIPLSDLHSPCRLHRREVLELLPPQSASRFLDVELLAKASFFAQLVDEADIPPLPSSRGPSGFWGDFLDVFRRPVIRHKPPPAAEAEVTDSSAPPEDPQGDDERDDRPGHEDQEVRPDLRQPGPFEDHPA